MTNTDWDAHITSEQNRWDEKLEKVTRVIAIPMAERRDWLNALWRECFAADRDAIQSVDGLQWGYLVHHGLNSSPELFDAKLEKLRSDLIQLMKRA